MSLGIQTCPAILKLEVSWILSLSHENKRSYCFLIAFLIPFLYLNYYIAIMYHTVIDFEGFKVTFKGLEL